eukprot:TRINITY_DN2569_c1_g2_i2.p1 TRINITY_DN2569_c1_g2~~TRINITY_DN2569_c1_g2_i2.p1  ORF type:complete len:531 (+),score=34.18 TRINITY_DN2569_c1_g2_i2:133-1593(+)
MVFCCHIFFIAGQLFMPQKVVYHSFECAVTAFIRFALTLSIEDNSFSCDVSLLCMQTVAALVCHFWKFGLQTTALSFQNGVSCELILPIDDGGFAKDILSIEWAVSPGRFIFVQLIVLIVLILSVALANSLFESLATGYFRLTTTEDSHRAYKALINEMCDCSIELDSRFGVIGESRIDKLSAMLLRGVSGKDLLGQDFRSFIATQECNERFCQALTSDQQGIPHTLQLFLRDSNGSGVSFQLFWVRLQFGQSCYLLGLTEIGERPVPHAQDENTKFSNLEKPRLQEDQVSVGTPSQTSLYSTTSISDQLRISVGLDFGFSILKSSKSMRQLFGFRTGDSLVRRIFPDDARTFEIALQRTINELIHAVGHARGKLLPQVRMFDGNGRVRTVVMEVQRHLDSEASASAILNDGSTIQLYVVSISSADPITRQGTPRELAHHSLRQGSCSGPGKSSSHGSTHRRCEGVAGSGDDTKGGGIYEISGISL